MPWDLDTKHRVRPAAPPGYKAAGYNQAATALQGLPDRDQLCGDVGLGTQSRPGSMQPSRV